MQTRRTLHKVRCFGLASAANPLQILQVALRYLELELCAALKALCQLIVTVEANCRSAEAETVPALQNLKKHLFAFGHGPP